MRRHAVLPWSSKLTAIALVGVAVGIWIQALSGVAEYPTFPPGPVALLAVAAVIVLVDRWWWIPMSGLLLSALILVGAVVRPGTANRLSDPAAVGAFTGTLIQVLALVLGVAAGRVATVPNYRGRTSAA